MLECSTSLRRRSSNSFVRGSTGAAGVCGPGPVDGAGVVGAAMVNAARTACELVAYKRSGVSIVSLSAAAEVLSAVQVFQVSQDAGNEVKACLSEVATYSAHAADWQVLTAGVRRPLQARVASRGRLEQPLTR